MSCRWRWLAWAWINCLCFSVEITAKKLFKQRAEQGRERGGWASALKGSAYYRLAEAGAAAFNILCLITVSTQPFTPALAVLVCRCLLSRLHRLPRALHLPDRLSPQANCAIMFGFGGSYDFLYNSFAKAGGLSSLALCLCFYAALNM